MVGTLVAASKEGGRRRSSTKSMMGKTSTPISSGNKRSLAAAAAASDPDPDDPDRRSQTDIDDGDNRHWMRRVVRLALPVQLAILTLFCAACLLEPNCCDTLNNFSWSFTPQLRYVRGPPPI